jgi:hypothetical protein
MLPERRATKVTGPHAVTRTAGGIARDEREPERCTDTKLKGGENHAGAGSTGRVRDTLEVAGRSRY